MGSKTKTAEFKDTDILKKLQGKQEQDDKDTKR